MVKRLVSIGVSPTDAQTLEAAYSNEPDFMAGLQAVASIIKTGTKPKNSKPPTGEPWVSIHDDIMQNGKPPIDALQDSLAGYAAALSWAISAAVTAAVAQIKSQPTQTAKRRVIHSSEYENALCVKLGYKFSLSALDDRIHVNNVPIDDSIAAQIRVAMRDLKYTNDRHFEDVYATIAARNTFHPVRDYFKMLTYDGGDHIARFVDHFTDKHGMFGTWLRKWLIGAVAKAYTGKHSFMFVWDGAQGIGKSEAARWLCPIEGFFIEGAINPDDKDAYKRLATKFVWEVAELGSTARRADREALKAFLSTELVTVRQPYARYDMVKPALANFIGTVNSDVGFLSDPTGHRRFVSTGLTAIDWDYQKSLSVHDIWAEAHAAYLDGETWLLDRQEQQVQAEINSEYEIDDPIEGILLKHFVITRDANDWLPTTTILHELELHGLKGSTRGNAMALSGVMAKLGLPKKRQVLLNGQRAQGYIGIKLDNPLNIGP